VSSCAYILGRKAFAAISAVEGIELSAAGKRRLKKNANLTPEQRRAEIILAYAGRKER
jgi:hypothetical protein